MSDTEQRLIDANELKRIAYQRFGLSAIKLITLIDEIPTASALTVNIPGEDKEKHDGF